MKIKINICDSKDIDHEENYIRPELSKKLLDEFKDDLSKNEVVRNQYRDKIMSIAKNGSKVSEFLLLYQKVILFLKFFNTYKIRL